MKLGYNTPKNCVATNIRKDLATKTVNLALIPDEKVHVMNFMEHSEIIHKTIYRQPDRRKDISIMLKVLNFATGNQDTLTENTPGTVDRNFERN